MPKISAFTGYLVNPQHAEKVVAPDYDSVSPEKKRQFTDTNPHNFLNTMRLLDDFPQNEKPTYQQLLSDNKSNLDKLLEDGLFDYFDQPSIFIYQIKHKEHQQTGVVCEIPVSEYEQGLILKHENTRSEKEDLLAKYQQVVGAVSSPIGLTYAQDSRIDSLLEKLMQSGPTLHFQTEDYIEQKVWRIDNTDNQAELYNYFNDTTYTYLTDGHHRAASGRRYAELMRPQHGNNGDEPHNQLLVALFPSNQLNILPCHRCVKDLGDKDEATIINDLKQCFDVEPLPNCNHYQPTQHGEFGICIGESWYRLNAKKDIADISDPVTSLDAVILQNYILDPVFGINDARNDSRLDYIAGTDDIKERVSQKKHNGWQVIITCYATAIEHMMRVADAQQLMPPKSTYFDPKPKPGIFIRMK